MTEYVPIVIMFLVTSFLVFTLVWSLVLIIWALFGDMILHHLRIREARKKWKDEN